MIIHFYYEMNNEQQKAFQSIENGKNIFVTGGAGTGKTFLILQTIEKLKHSNKKIGITSMTGSSALLINGTTCHSYLGIGILKDRFEMLKKIRSRRKQKKWIDLDLLIIDEVSMLSKELFEALDWLGKEIRRDPRPFGGIQLFLCGDFCQLGCVGSDFFCFESDIWAKTINEQIELKIIYRQKEDDVYAELLQNCRFGIINDTHKKLLLNRMDIKCPDIIQPTILYPYKKDIQHINEHYLNELLKKEKKYEYVYKSTHDKKKITLYNIPEKIVLCKGCQVVLTVNLDIESGLINGSRGVVIDFIDNLPFVLFRNGIRIIIPYYHFEIEDDDKITYSQVPLILGWALTIHKSQGMTLDCVKTNLRYLFEYGQGYVTLSRLRSLDNLYLEDINFKKIICNPKVYDFYNK